MRYRGTALGLAIGVVALLASGCEGSDGSRKHYPAESITAFMASCQTNAQKSGMTIKQAGDSCVCVIKRLEASVPFEDFVAIENRLVAGDRLALSEKVIAEAAAECTPGRTQTSTTPAQSVPVTGDTKIKRLARAQKKIVDAADKRSAAALQQIIDAVQLQDPPEGTRGVRQLLRVSKRSAAEMKAARAKMQTLSPSSPRGRSARTLFLKALSAWESDHQQAVDAATEYLGSVRFSV